MNQFRILHVDEPTEPPSECNIQTREYHFKSSTYPPKNSPVVSAIMGWLNHRTIGNGDVELHPLYFPVESNSKYVPYTYNTLNKSIDDDKIYHLLELFHSENDDDPLDVEIQMLQYLMVVAPPSNFYAVSTVLFHKYGGANVAVINCISHFSMFVPTNSTVKISNVNMVHTQVIGIILCRFPNCSIIYTVVPVYYSPGRPFNTISSGALKFYVGF